MLHSAIVRKRNQPVAHVLNTVALQPGRQRLGADTMFNVEGRMKTVREYLRHAEECDRLARNAVSEEQRQMILHMADTWRALADTRRRVILKADEPVTIGNGRSHP